MKQSLNLMSERSRKREQVRYCLRIWSRALLGVLSVLSTAGFVQWRSCREVTERQMSAEAEYEPIRQLKLESNRLAKQIEVLQAADRVPLVLANQRPLLSLIGLATQAVAEQRGSIYLQQIEIERDPLPLESTRSPTLTFSLAGAGNDSRAVTQLADALREVGPFAHVELDTNSVAGPSNRPRQEFSIQGAN